ncbi:MAG: ribonuclease III [Syntrophobacteraceae bacterium]|nr:ribonuclease III [Syntrophobacteraceae bacterium]
MNDASHLEDLQTLLGYRFDHPELLLRALVHRSYVHENPHQDQKDNETLEFLGDAVLSLAISHLLLSRFPDHREGDLSRLRSSIVNERELAAIATALHIGKHLKLGKGEDLTGGRQKSSLLADSLEALLAAVYLDGGLQASIAVVEKLFGGYLQADQPGYLLSILDKDYKTQLQEVTQGRHKMTPEYVLESEEGPDHDKTFFVCVVLDGRVLARGTGKSKKEAQQEAAQKALEQISAEVDPTHAS